MMDVQSLPSLLRTFPPNSSRNRPNVCNGFIATIDEEYPAQHKPVPMSSVEAPRTFGMMLDPVLCITPEKKLASVLRRRTLPTDGLNEDRIAVNDKQNTNLRESRVRFDKNVAIHHLSPEYSTDSNSTENYTSGLSIASDSHESHGMLADISMISNSETGLPLCDDLLESSDIWNNKIDLLSSQQGRVGHFGLYGDDSCDSALLAFGDSSDCEPISVVASDIRASSSEGSRLGLLPDSLKAAKISKSQPRKSSSLPLVRDSPQKLLSKPFVIPASVHGSGVLSSLQATASSLESRQLSTASQRLDLASRSCSTPVTDNALARPELNSMLRMGREIADLRGKTSDLTSIIKEKIDEKMRTKITEKVLNYFDQLLF